MFARAKPKTVVIAHALAIDAKGFERVVPPSYISGNKLMPARATLRRATLGGVHRARPLCASIAERLVRQGIWKDVRMIEVRTDVYNTATYFAKDRKPMSSKLRARCSGGPWR
jgi:hypothetical protein